MNKWIIALIYSFLFTIHCYFSIKILLLSVINATTFPNPHFFYSTFVLICGIWILAFGIRKYISTSTKDEKERQKLKIIFSIFSVLSGLTTIMIFFI